VSFVERFDPMMLEAAAQELDLRYYVNGNRSVLALLVGDDIGTPIWIHLSAEGLDRTMFVVRVYGGHYFEQADWPRVVELLNQWHCHRPFPRVTLAHLSDSQFAEVQCDGHLYTLWGVHQALVTDFARQVLWGSLDFWKWMMGQLPQLDRACGELDGVEQLSMKLEGHGEA